MTFVESRRILLSLSLTTVAVASMVLLGGCNTTVSPNNQISDVQITAQVKAKLASDVRASSLANIHVNTTNGIVTLAGEVETEDVKNKAETVTASIPGVVRVNDALQVQSSAVSVPH